MSSISIQISGHFNSPACHHDRHCDNHSNFRQALERAIQQAEGCQGGQGGNCQAPGSSQGCQGGGNPLQSLEQLAQSLFGGGQGASGGGLGQILQLVGI
jgi:hypothetical protein